MSKTSLSILMLQILYSRNRVSIAELAELLDTNPRNISEYKKELERAGYYIETIPSRYGGYVLNKRHLFPSVTLEDSEKKALLDGYDYLLSRNDFMETRELAKAMGKIAASVPHADSPLVVQLGALTKEKSIFSSSSRRWQDLLFQQSCSYFPTPFHRSVHPAAAGGERCEHRDQENG